MKKVEAIIKPYLLESVKDALQEQGIVGMTISEIMSFSRHLPGSPGAPAMPFSPCSPCLKLEVVVANADVEPAIETIRRAGLARASSGSLYVQALDDVVRIRTAEHGEAAI